MKKIIIVIILVCILIASAVWKSVSYNPHHLTIRSESLKSPKIDSSLNGTSIVYFTDLHYGTYTNDDDLNKCIDTINKLNPDVVVFGGDLIDDYPDSDISQDQIQKLVSKLKSIIASQGKYFILGNDDLYNDECREQISNILSLGGFVSLVNTNYKIYNGTNSYINIVGLDSLLNGNPDISNAFNGLDPLVYTIAFAHCPDLFDEIPLSDCDYVIAGHSHGGQIYIPLFDRLYRAKGSLNYFHGKHKKNTTTLDISNGVGLTSYSIRFNAPAEIVYYKLES